MNVKLPQKGSIVISINSSEPNNAKNSFTEKRLDSLEKQLNLQYKRFQNNEPNNKELLQKLEKSFASRIDKMISSNNKVIGSKLTDLKEVFKDYVSNNKKEGDDELIKALSKKLTSLETAIKNIPEPKVKVVNRNGNMNKAFEEMFARLEKAILKARPRLTPMPM